MDSSKGFILALKTVIVKLLMVLTKWALDRLSHSQRPSEAGRIATPQTKKLSPVRQLAPHLKLVILELQALIPGPRATKRHHCP